MPFDATVKRIVIMGAAGRDFHNFNVCFRNDPRHRVVAFTASQIPKIAGRRYPPELTGPLYPDGIEIIPEQQLPALCRQQQIDQVIFAYSDIAHSEVMHKASEVLATGADFLLLGPQQTMLRASIPVIAVCAVRTGCGKSQTARWISRLLRQHGLKVAVIRHPMPYGDLRQQVVQRFTNKQDLLNAQCTVEEREEYEPHLALGNTVFAGVDYAQILSRAESEADLVLWDGGNNDFPFIRPDLHIVLVDPLRPGHETSHHPGETVLRMADIVLVAKANSASDVDIQRVTEHAQALNPGAVIVRGTSLVTLDDADLVTGKRVLVVEDGPTITHGGMPYGAGYVAATQAQAAEIVDPRISAAPEIAAVYAQYPHIGPVLPAVGYHSAQLKALQETINTARADVVLCATPCELGGLIGINKPIVHAHYEFAELGRPELGRLLDSFLLERKLI